MPEKRQTSDLNRAFKEDGAVKTHVGGQALLEGVMMRGKHNWAVAVREPTGRVYVEEHGLASGKRKNKWLYWPLVRGCRALVESLMLGYKALSIAGEHAFANEEDPPEKRGQSPFLGSGDGGSVQKSQAPSSGEGGTFSWKDDFGRPDTVIDALGAQRSLEVVGLDEGEKPLDADAPAAADAERDKEAKRPAPEGGEPEFGRREMAISMVLGVVLGAALFIIAPALLTNLLVGEYDGNPLVWNIVDGIVRVFVFVLYLWLVGRMKDIKRMFGYHGAEHKAIHCYEHGLELTPENARQFPRLHVRCGTAFIIMVMIIAILVYTVLPLNALIAAWGIPDGAPKLALVIAIRILFLPLIAGISYEITVKWAGNHPDNPLVKVILWPGMQLQYLTTNEPDDGQLECAIAAMGPVLEREAAEAEGAGKPEAKQGTRESSMAGG